MDHAALREMFLLFDKRYKEGKTMDKIQKILEDEKHLFSEQDWKTLCDQISISKMRISFYCCKVVEHRQFLSVTQSGQWQQLTTVQDYFDAIAYLQNEYLKIHNLIRDQVSLKKKSSLR